MALHGTRNVFEGQTSYEDTTRRVLYAELYTTTQTTSDLCSTRARFSACHVPRPRAYGPPADTRRAGCHSSYLLHKPGMQNLVYVPQVQQCYQTNFASSHVRCVFMYRLAASAYTWHSASATGGAPVSQLRYALPP